MPNAYQPTAAGFGQVPGDGGAQFDKTADNVVGFGGAGPPSNRSVVALRIFKGTAANAATATCRIPFDCEIVAIEGNSTSGTTPTFTLSSVSPFASVAHPLDGTLITSLTPLEKTILKRGNLLTATLNNGGGNTVDAQVTVWVQAIGLPTNA